MGNYIHADRAGRISAATVAGAIGARPMSHFRDDLVRLDILDGQPGAHTARIAAYSVTYSDSEAVISRTARPVTLSRPRIQWEMRPSTRTVCRRLLWAGSYNHLALPANHPG